jgi:hypothetical protein
LLGGELGPRLRTLVVHGERDFPSHAVGTRHRLGPGDLITRKVRGREPEERVGIVGGGVDDLLVVHLRALLGRDLGRLPGAGRISSLLPQHLPEGQLRGRADQLQGALLILHTGELNEDVVLPPRHLRLRHPEGIDALANDLYGLVQHLGVARTLSRGAQDDADAALEIEAQFRFGVRCKHGAEAAEGHEQGQDEIDLVAPRLQRSWVPLMSILN